MHYYFFSEFMEIFPPCLHVAVLQRILEYFDEKENIWPIVRKGNFQFTCIQYYPCSVSFQILDCECSWRLAVHTLTLHQSQRATFPCFPDSVSNNPRVPPITHSVTWYPFPFSSSDTTWDLFPHKNQKCPHWGMWGPYNGPVSQIRVPPGGLSRTSGKLWQDYSNCYMFWT